MAVNTKPLRKSAKSKSSKKKVSSRTKGAPSPSAFFGTTGSGGRREETLLREDYGKRVIDRYSGRPKTGNSFEVALTSWKKRNAQGRYDDHDNFIVDKGSYPLEEVQKAQADYFEACLHRHAPTIDLLEGTHRNWNVKMTTVETWLPYVEAAVSNKLLLETPQSDLLGFLQGCYFVSKSPTVKALIEEAEALPKMVPLGQLPSWVLEGRVGRRNLSALVSLYSDHRMTGQISVKDMPPIPQWLFNLSQGGFGKLGQAALKKLHDDRVSEFKFTLSVEPHVFLALGNLKGNKYNVDDGSCFACTSSNGDRAWALAIQPSSVVGLLYVLRSSGASRRRISNLYGRAWGSLTPDQLGLTNFYPGRGNGAQYIFVSAVLACLFPRVKPSLLNAFQYLQAPPDPEGRGRNALWKDTLINHGSNFLYSNGDTVLFRKNLEHKDTHKPIPLSTPKELVGLPILRKTVLGKAPITD